MKNWKQPKVYGLGISYDISIFIINMIFHKTKFYIVIKKYKSYLHLLRAKDLWDIGRRDKIEFENAGIA